MSFFQKRLVDLSYLSLYLYAHFVIISYTGTVRPIIVAWSQAPLVWGALLGYMTHRLSVFFSLDSQPLKYAHVAICASLFLYSFTGRALQWTVEDERLQEVLRHFGLYHIDNFLRLLMHGFRCPVFGDCLQ